MMVDKPCFSYRTFHWRLVEKGELVNSVFERGIYGWVVADGPSEESVSIMPTCEKVVMR
jgi:hypothetical protein